MLTPREEATLRDAMCVQLLEATSDPAALTRVRRETRENVPAYDPDPDPAFRHLVIQPRDRIGRCAVCGDWIVVAHAPRVYCSEHCRQRARRRRRAERVA